MVKNNNIAVKVEHVSKSFKLPTESSQSLRTTLVNLFKGIKGYVEYNVLQDISFEVEKGDFFGIVGRNGSGKSTLLKILSQIYVPERGTV
ncbi:ABC transporter ATP-binding protein, partial [Streptococcus suis]|nr:ABC transporter ATP-binding protein [Streptococcus suis]